MSLGLGCSDEPKANACDDVTCESGICDPNTKQCVNPKTCAGDEACLPGFSCEASQCVADIACDSNNPCDRGQCIDGACMNASTCAIEADCVSGYYCGDDSVCHVNNCEDTTCDRGQCIPATGQCANAATCTRATEKVDCLEDNYCLGQICVSAATVCEELACENGRGVCDPAARACVNADNCEGNDQNCVAGSFCNANNTCQINKCEPATGQCDRGVCSPDNGSCVNVDTCTGLTGCIDNFLCISGTCESTTTACESCTGNQTCSQNEADLSAQCGESPNGCFNGLGCLDDRVCQAGSCIDSPTCEADLFEPNNTPEEAADLNAAMQEGVVNASLCNGDVDFFKFDTRLAGLTRGALLTEIRTKSEDIGNTNFKVIVRNPAGEIRAESTSSNTGIIALEVPVNAAQQGVYTIEVQDLGGTKTAGLRYAVFSQMIPTTVTAACSDNIKTLTPGLVNGNTLDGRTYEMGSTCTSDVNTAREHIYQITIDQRSHVNFIARPAGDVEITMSLRHSCSSMLSELECANLGGRGQPERLTMTLDPGTYFLIVKGPKASTGGAYTLEYTRETTICHPGVPYCTNEQTSAICNDNGTAHTKVLCENGCVQDGGYCDGEPGDTCYVAIDATGGFTGTVDWSKLNGDYKLGKDAEKCLPVDEKGATIGTAPEDSVGGPDQTFVVNVGPGETLQVDLTTTNLDYGSIYLVDDCQSVASSCLAGAFTATATRGEFKKSLVWKNPSNQSQRVYVVADGGKNWIGTAKIQIAHGPPACDAGISRCAEDGLEVCNLSGTAFQLTRECSFGCGYNNGVASCNYGENNVCKGAFDIAALGGTYEGFIDDYTNNYNPGAWGCTGQSGSSGPDSTFFVDADAGDVITSMLTADFSGSLWVTTDCSDAARHCVAGSRGGALATEFLHFVAPEKGRYYIVVDSLDNKQFGKYRLDVSVELPMCPPGNVIGCAADGKTLMVCGELGTPTPHLCETSCSGMACDQPNGDICADAIPVKDGDIVGGVFSGRNAVNPGPGQVGQCFFESDSASIAETHGPNGPDTIYSVELKAGQTLHVTGSLQKSTSGAVFYLLEDCNQPAQSCLVTTQPNTNPDIVYIADEDKTIFVVADRLNSSAIANGYILNFNIVTPECEPGERTCSDASTQKTCNALGMYEDFACPNGCQGGKCANPTGDVCADAITLKHLDVVDGGFLGTNSMAPGKAAGQCSFGTSDTDGGARGADTFYAIQVQAGQRLIADLDTNTNSVMYILKECGRADSCVANTKYVSGTKEYRLEYVAEQDELIYLVVDLNGISATSTQTYTLSIDLQFEGCSNPGEYTCLEDNKTLGLCGDDGFYTNYICETGCRNAQCQKPHGGICADQVKLISGQRVEGNFNNPIRDEFNIASFGECNVSLTAAQRRGAETYYSIDMLEGELLLARLQSGSVAFMYVTDDCNEGTDRCVDVSAPQNQQSELMYVADRDKTITLVVRGTSATRSTGKFTLEVFLQEPGCSEGAVTCLDDKSLGVCNGEGSFAAYVCEGGCENDACKTPSGQFCQDAIMLTEGVPYTKGNFAGWNTINPGRLSDGTSGACDFGTTGTPGREMVYAIEAPAGQVIRVKMTPEYEGALTNTRMYLLEDCTSTESCLVNSISKEDELIFYNDSSRILFLVVDYTTAATNTYVYDIEVNFENPCVDGEIQCSADGKSVQICDAEAQHFNNYVCSSNSCTDGACNAPNGYTCQDAIPVVSGQIVKGDFSESRGNSINPGKQAIGSCNFGTNDGTGMDTIYAVEMLEGQVLKADLTASVSYQMLYVLDDCHNANSCLVNSVTSSSSGKLDPLYYFADRDKTVFVVVDRSSSANTSTFELEFTVSASVCTPGELSCQGDNVGVCSDYHIWDIYKCEEGCTDGACNQPRGNACFDAIPLVPDTGWIAGNWDSDTRVSAFNPPTGTVGQCAMGSAAHAGVDTVYAISAKAGETLRADLYLSSSLSNARMYILESCEQSNTCQVITSTVANNRMMLTYNPTVDGTVFLVIDYASATATTGSYELKVTSTPTCSAGQQRCSADGTMVEICDALTGSYESFACAFDMCSNNACTTPGGRFCQDAIPLVDGQTVTGDFSGFSRLLPGDGKAGKVGECTFEAGTSGPRGAETIYAVDLLEGEVLTAVANSQEDSTGLLLYVLDDCLNENSCLANVPYPKSKGVGVTLNFQAPNDGTFFLVMDYRHLKAADFTLSISIEDAEQCSVGSITCMDANTLGICNRFGTMDPFACEGGCANDRCGAPKGNVCFDAIPVTDGFYMDKVFADATSEMDPGAGSCFPVLHMNLTGAERIFSVDLNEGDLLKARVDGSNIHPQVAMYVLDDCVQSAHNSCVHGVQKVKTLEFYAPATQTYFLVVDSATPPSNVELWVEIEEAAATCQPGGSTCDHASGVVSICNADGSAIDKHVQCAYGCNFDACAGQEPANNTCATAMEITGDTRIIDAWSRFTGTYNMTSKACGNGVGRDAVYKVKLAPDQMIRATASSLHYSYQAVVYLVEGCPDSTAASCLATATSIAPSEKNPGQSSASIEYLSLNGGDYFLVVDASSSAAAAITPFQLDVEFLMTECIPGEQICNVDGHNIDVCSPAGLWETKACAYGCGNDACLPATNHTCADAYDASNGLDINISMADYTNDYDAAAGIAISCTGRDTHGPEAVFYVDVEKNDLITAALSSDGFDPAVWITSDCGGSAKDIANACVAGKFTMYNRNASTSYRVPEAGRYFIFADSWFGSSGTFPTGNMDVKITVTPAVCDAFEVTCLDADTVAYCLANGSSFAEYTCNDGCDNGLCGTPRGGLCTDAINATAGGVFTGNFSDVPNTSDPGFGSCTGFEAPGRDAFYAVELAAGQTLKATLSNGTGVRNDLSLYVVTDCTDSRDSCLVGSDQYGYVAETVTYTATQSGTVYVVADAWNADASGEYKLVIELQ